jgi:hypothetical protein
VGNASIKSHNVCNKEQQMCKQLIVPVDQKDPESISKEWSLKININIILKFKSTKYWQGTELIVKVNLHVSAVTHICLPQASN